ncbi:hypothetical protein [Epilithonimonas hungarica]|uniref:Uncharacterized protein n=1 Tax=Epilithonimonas hungarica TaxID=454006 RepID=A0A1G7PHD9_9FLAO|nr:hypothetical protein [Epilithonimonas hungarica]SDF85673.1 hypothetical protein SAMN05421825_2296 [Epilithonimonas hungarica]
MDKKLELQQKQERMEELKPIVSKGFPTDEELDLYIEKNKKYFDEYDILFKEIQKLKYEIKTPQEKEEYDEYLRKLKLKAEGKPLI